MFGESVGSRGWGVTLIWRLAVVVIHIIVMKLYWHYLNLADSQKIAKPPN